MAMLDMIYRESFGDTPMNKVDEYCNKVFDVIDISGDSNKNDPG